MKRYMLAAYNWQVSDKTGWFILDLVAHPDPSDAANSRSFIEKNRDYYFLCIAHFEEMLQGKFVYLPDYIRYEKDTIYSDNLEELMKRFELERVMSNL